MRTRARLTSASAVVLLSLALIIPQAVMAKRLPGEALRQLLEVAPDESRETVRRGNGSYDLRSGAPRTLFRIGYTVRSDAPEAMAREYLGAHVELLHLDADDLADLTHESTWESLAGHTVRFQQRIDGLPVYGGDLAVTIDSRGQVIFVSSGYQPGLRLSTSSPVFAAAGALALASAHMEYPRLSRAESVDLIVYPRHGQARLAWRVRMQPAEIPFGDWEILVDAASGMVFKAVDRALYADGSGGVFDPDPLSSAGVTYGDPGFTDGGDADTPQLNAEVADVTLLDLTLNGGVYQLDGPYAAIRDFESPFKGTFSQANPNFDFTRTQDAFEAVHTYFHIDHIMRYINTDLGLDLMPFQYSGGVRFDPHGLSGADNSHYLSGSGQLAFGEGGVDDAEDADVVIHELGHGLHDWVTGGHLSQVNGLSEGFGDYLAVSYSRSLGQWSPGDPAYNWVFVWDGHNPFWGGRITDYNAHYPEDLTGQIHTDGQIWSTCNMRIWDQIGRQQIDRAMLVGLGMTGGNTNQEDAAQAVLEAAVALGYPGSEVDTMETIYRSCGYDVGVSALVLTVGGSCPGSMSVTISGATANGQLPVALAPVTGSFLLPGGVCAGTELNLSGPQLLAIPLADANGELGRVFSPPASACGQFLQIVDLATCRTSNVAQLP